MTDRKAYPRVRKATERLTNRRSSRIKVPDSYAPFARNVDAYMFRFQSHKSDWAAGCSQPCADHLSHAR
jgi:hypothetical protein